MDKAAIERAKDHFAKLLEVQMQRMERIKAMPDWIDYGQLKPIKIGILAGDGIGPFIAKDSRRVLEYLLQDEV
jgi:isocitrate dehydrogenase (NAD+)